MFKKISTMQLMYLITMDFKRATFRNDRSTHLIPGVRKNQIHAMK